MSLKILFFYEFRTSSIRNRQLAVKTRFLVFFSLKTKQNKKTIGLDWNVTKVNCVVAVLFYFYVFFFLFVYCCGMTSQHICANLRLICHLIQLENIR